MGALIELIIWIGSVGGGFAVIYGLYKWVNSRRDEIELSLQYGIIQPIISENSSGKVSAISIRAFLDNPQDQPIYVEPVSLLTSIDGRTSNIQSSKMPRQEIAADCKYFVVHGAPVKIKKFDSKKILPGRLDWVIRFGPMSDRKNVKLQKTLKITGTLNIHRFDWGPEAQWLPDEGSEHPVITDDQIAFMQDRNGRSEFVILGARGPGLSE